MTTTQAVEPASMKPIRYLPGIVAAVLFCLARFVLPLVAPDAGVIGFIAALVLAIAIFVWWAFFSRAPKVERWGGLMLMIGASAVARLFIDKSIATGMMGMMFAISSIQVLSLVLVIWAVLTQHLSTWPRRATGVAAILLACGFWLLLRTDGLRASGSDFAWRWTKTSEQRLLEQAAVQPLTPTASIAAEKVDTQQQPRDTPVAAVAAAIVEKTAYSWPGFRGPGRDSNISGTRINTDWASSPPVEIWRRAVGPGWSSFAVQGDLLYTQEQRGEDEIVSCYSASTGKAVWVHRDKARFWESNAGAGPRGTPTLDKGRVYSFGATGILNALDAGNGSVIWSRNAASDTGRKIPDWGFASSPLVVGGMVVIATSGQLAAYDAASGELRWIGPANAGGYSSPQLSTIDGVAQILLANGAGVASVAVGDGTLLWKHSWSSSGGILQTSMTADGDLLLAGGGAMGGNGMRRIALKNSPGGWTIEERWTSSGLKPYFSDFVVHDGHVFGFDGSILACIDAKDGKRKWKGGRYGQGQLVLLRDQGLLLVLTEEGEVALVGAGTGEFKELARFPAMEGKTWNHPVVVGDRLWVRNSNEMAAFGLPIQR